ncbi:MAG TPA: NAD-glutamate dehydrogenase domain-containing protein, partial [Burkholderiales bacterium]
MSPAKRNAKKPSGPSLRSGLVNRLAKAARARLSAPRAALAEQFTRLYYAGADPQELAQLDPADLVGAAAAHLEFARRAKGSRVQVRVFNPRLETHGWQSTHTVVQIVGEDMPFLVDSTAMEINRQGLTLHLMLHPVMRLVRDAKGNLRRIGAPGSDEGRLESLIHVEVDRQVDPVRLEELGAGLLRVLADVRAAVEDWKPMRARLAALAEEFVDAKRPMDVVEAREAHAFLGWLLDNHMTLLGYRDYNLVREKGEDVLRIVRGSGLGILRERKGTTVSTSFATLPAEVRRRARMPEILVLAKANTRATVHRPGYLDYVGVKRFDARGRVIGERRILGLYTHNVYTASLATIPVVRRKIADVQARAGFRPASHSGKALASILEDYPRDELLQIEPEDLHAHAIAILQLGERQRTRLFVRRDAYGRYVTCLVYVPREQYGTGQRQLIQRLLAEAFDGTATEFSVSLSESPLARIFIVVRTRPGRAKQVDVGELEARIVAAIRRWEDDLHALLVAQHGEARGNELHARYGRAFPAGYREDNPVATALADIAAIETLGTAAGPGMDLYRPAAGDPGVLRFRLYRAGTPIVLSDALPILENLGVRVLDDQPYEIERAGGAPVWIVDFGLALPATDGLALERVRPLFHDAFEAMWSGRVEPDSLNQLVLGAELSAREIVILRAYSGYLRQVGIAFGRAYMQQTLVAHPKLARALVQLFHARFEPGRASAKDEAAKVREIEAGLDAVPSLDDDRILRQFLATIGATKRTNAFQTGADGAPRSYVSLKFDPRKVPGLPEPRPMFEIFVYSPRV